MKISVVVATYNRPDALDVVLQSLECQTDLNFEIIVADDGSGDETKAVVENHIKKTNNLIKHVWHEDLGFRLSKIRNLAIESATGSYLIFLDGDCAVQPDFVKNHRLLSEEGFLVTGSRILLSKDITEHICANRSWNFATFKRNSFIFLLKKQINKFLPLFIKLPDNSLRKYTEFKWRRIKGCNLACWKLDAIRINGFDESLIGWGHEDADFVFRMYQNNINRKSGAWSTEVLHLWHKMANKENAEKNAAIVRAKILAKRQP
jgi:glycosyltransferase involved in cell wall biosynthesis